MSHHSDGSQIMVVAPAPSADDLINRMASELKDLEVYKFFRA
jgi:hypothetical protein